MHYYNYLKQAKASYHAKKSKICRKIKEIYHEFGGILGHRSIRVFLARNQMFLSKTTVHQYMNKELHLQCVCRRKRPGYKKGHAHKIFPNLLERNFMADKSNQIWCTDLCSSCEWFHALQLYYYGFIRPQRGRK